MKPQRSLFWLIILCSVSLSLSVLHNNGSLNPIQDTALRVLSPLQKLTSDISRSVSDGADDIASFSQLRSTNESLLREKNILLAEVARLRNTDRENDSLRQAVGYMKQHPELKITTAGIIGRDSSKLLDTILVDRGRSDGIAPGMPVVANGGLVGRVVSSSARTSRILPVSSPQSSVNVVVQGEYNDADGTVTGSKGELLKMSKVVDQDVLKPGLFVITSGHGGGFPRGILVGQVVNITSNSSTIMDEANIRAFVRSEDITTVQIITSFSSG